MASLNSLFNTLCIPFAALAAARMVHHGLHRRYRFLFAYIVFLIPFSAYPALLNVRSALYFWTWVGTLPLNLALETLVVVELCRLVLEDHPGLSTLGRWAIYGGIGISAAISLASLAPRIATSISRRSGVLLYLLGTSRGVNLSLAVFLIVMLLMVSGYPMRLRRNVVLNTVIFALQFFCNTLADLLRTIFDLKLNPAVDTVVAGTGVLSLLLWFFLLTPEGETVCWGSHILSPQNERFLLSRLDSLNRFALSLASRQA